MDKDNRIYSRIGTRIRAYARKVESANAVPLFHGGDQAGSRPSPLKLKEAGIPEVLREYLEVIDRKLDLLVNSIGQDRLREDFPLRADVVELSGAGLRVIAPGDGLTVGDLVEVVLLLAQFPLSIAGAVGIIQRAESFQGQSVLVLEFTSIRESDREAIVQFVFREQRERIRENLDR